MIAQAARAFPVPHPAQPRIHDYALIGDGRSAALVSREGSIDWLCWPRFESPSIFARLLDVERGGSWSIRPCHPARISRRYVQDTNVLETTFESDGGTAVLVDLMTVASEDDKKVMLVPDHEIVRHLRCERGSVTFELRVDPRLDYGRAVTRTSTHPLLGIRWQAGATLLTFLAETPFVLETDGVAHATVTLQAGQSIAMSLTYDADGPALVPLLGDAVRERIERSVRWWARWSARAKYDGPYRDLVVRSALAVKLMAFAPSGAIIAAPTTSLPERLGGDRNWDYRFCWLRDASFTARALLSLGYTDEAEAFVGWLLHTTRLTQPELRVLYDVYGNRTVHERVLPFRGYRDSRPVRIGNAATEQLQLDCYGEVIDAASQLAHAMGSLDRDTQSLLRDFGEYVCRNWRRPDQGIWEPRGLPQHRTHSRLLCWVALERLRELGQQRIVARIDPARYAAERDAIRADIEAYAFDPQLGCYTGVYGTPTLDASVLLMTWYGFQRGDTPRMQSTFATLSRQLAAGPGLLFRRDIDRHGREGAFWICSFWAVEHLAGGGGSPAEATAWMTAACRYANDLGLMAEEIEPATGEALGNFPQAYTHVGLISAALSLQEREGLR